jgi:hypothetical protein
LSHAVPEARLSTNRDPGVFVILEPGWCRDAFYLRAAQAYMLISMPTGTSAIFGDFQIIYTLRSQGTIAAEN